MSALKLRVHILNCRVPSGIFPCDRELRGDTPPVSGREEPTVPAQSASESSWEHNSRPINKCVVLFFFRKKENKTPANPTLGSV